MTLLASVDLITCFLGAVIAVYAMQHILRVDAKHPGVRWATRGIFAVISIALAYRGYLYFDNGPIAPLAAVATRAALVALMVMISFCYPIGEDEAS